MMNHKKKKDLGDGEDLLNHWSMMIKPGSGAGDAAVIQTQIVAEKLPAWMQEHQRESVSQIFKTKWKET